MPEPDEKPNRATTAIVAEKIDGLKELTNRGFSDVQRQLDRLGGVPEKVVELVSDFKALEKRVEDLEKSDERHFEWKRGPFLLVAVTAVGIIINLYLALH